VIRIVKVFVIPTDEERVFIEDTVALMEGRYDVSYEFHIQIPES
jgi:acetate kinase